MLQAGQRGPELGSLRHASPHPFTGPSGPVFPHQSTGWGLLDAFRVSCPASRHQRNLFKGPLEKQP